MTLSKLIESEVADFFAGFGGLGEPDIQSGEAQQQLTTRLLSLLERWERDKQEPVGYIVQDKYERQNDQTGHLSLSHVSKYVSDEDIIEHEITCTPLYTAPLVPDVNYQQLSDLYHAQEKRLFKIAQRIKGPAFDKYAYSPSQAIDVLEVAIFGESKDDCRAAALDQAHAKQPASNGGQS